MKESPPAYIDELETLTEDEYLFSGFKSNIHFWNINSPYIDARRKCSMGHSLESGSVVFTWGVAPYTFCVIQIDHLEEFIRSVEEIIEKDSPEEFVYCGELFFENSQNVSINSLESPSIEIKGDRLYHLNESEEIGYTDEQELKRLVDWLKQSTVRAKLTSSVL